MHIKRRHSQAKAIAALRDVRQPLFFAMSGLTFLFSILLLKL